MSLLQRIRVAAVLWSLLAVASTARAGLLWEDTVSGGGPDGQADDVVTDGSLVFASGFISTDGGTLALVRSYAARTGALAWEDVPPAPAAESGPLALDGGRLFATAFATSGNDGGGADWYLRAYDAASGHVLWTDLRDDGDFAGTADVAAIDGRVFATGTASEAGGSAAFTVRAYDAASGTLLWQDAPGDGGETGSGSVIAADASGRVFAAGRIGSTLHVAAYAQDTGEILWTHDSPGLPIVDELVVAGKRVFVAARVDGELGVRAYDASTGAQLWQRRESAPFDPIAPFSVSEVGLAATADLVVVGRWLTRAGATLSAWDAASGEPVWNVANAGVSRSLEVGDGRVLGVTGASAFLARAFTLVSGAPVWSTPLDVENSALALARSGSLVFVAGVAGPGLGTFHVAAFDTGRGFAIRPVPRGSRRLPITR